MNGGGDFIKENEMLNNSVGFLIVKLSFPVMAGMIVYSLFSLVDTFYVARLGSKALAAITISMPIQILITSVAAATGVGLTSFIARSLGQGEVNMADNTAWHGVIAGLIYGVLFFFVGMSYIDDLLIFFSCPPEIFLLSKSYLQIILIACVFTFIPILLGSIIQGEGNTFLPVFAALLAIIFNVVLDPVFIFGLGFVKGMGLDGAAVASVLAQILSTFLIIGIVCKRQAFLSWSWRNFKPSLKVIIEIYKVGLPTMIMEITGVVIMLYINRVLADHSYASIAALGIFLRVRSLAYMPVYGISQGAMPIAAFAYGAGNLDRVKETIIKASILSLFFMGGAWLIMQYYPLWIIDFFSDDPSLTLLASRCMRLATICMPLMGPLLILYTVFQALGKGATAMCLSLLRQLGFFLPLLLILPAYFSINGVWLAFSISELMSAAVAILFLIRLWRELQTGKKLALLMLFKTRYMSRRLLAWLRW